MALSKTNTKLFAYSEFIKETKPFAVHSGAKSRN
jgi:hypothetical protein